MGDIARRRARPWLVATALLLLGTSLLGSGMLVWFIGYERQSALYLSDRSLLLTVAWLDIAVSALLAIAVLLLGQAVTRYEIFTGKTLPRSGLSRHWRSAVVLAGGYGLVVGLSLTLQLHPIYGLLLSTILMVSFYSLFSWRSYAERERFMEHLRPFVTSQGMYKDVLAGVSDPSASSAVLPTGVDLMTPFHALCHDVLGTRVAYLAAVGPLSPLIAKPLVYRDAPVTAGIPVTGELQLPPLHDLTNHPGVPRSICMPVDPALYGGAHWAIPLWSERGLIGMLLLGEKRDGGVFAHEEIEIAQAIGERLIDTQASVVLAQRLVLLQRRQLTESQVLDRQARRALHDDVLPLLHTSMLVLSGPDRSANGHNGHVDNALALLSDAHHRITGLLRDMPLGVSPEIARVGLIVALQKVVSGELGDAFDEVEWHIEPEVMRKIGDIPLFASEVLFYAAREAMRNSARHGRDGGDPARPLRLSVSVAWRGGVKITIEDNGVGMETEALHKSGHPGSTGGRGLALHGTLMAVVGGSLSVERLAGIPSVPGIAVGGDEVTRVSLILPHREPSTL